jgi:hypothetical protein
MLESNRNTTGDLSGLVQHQLRAADGRSHPLDGHPGRQSYIRGLDQSRKAPRAQAAGSSAVDAASWVCASGEAGRALRRQQVGVSILHCSVWLDRSRKRDTIAAASTCATHPLGPEDPGLSRTSVSTAGLRAPYAFTPDDRMNCVLRTG